ncbi:MAG: BMP family ABC transporter substrate-binding protein [Polyangiaceae bacterium]
MTFERRRAAWLVGALLAALVVTVIPGRKTVSARPAGSAPKVRVGLVFDVGGRGDKSFNDAAYEGLTRAERELEAEVAFLEPSGAEDRESALRLFASRGVDLVIGVGFIFSSDVDTVARDYPSVSFACVDYAPRGEIPKNVAALSFKEEEGSFLVGAAAGLLSRTHHVAFAGGMIGPLIKKFEVGFATGAKATCPSCVVHAGYVGPTPEAYHDPAKAKVLASTQIAAGADVVYHASGASGHGVFEAAREAKVLAIGVDADQHDEMPGVVVTSMVKRADVAVFDVVREARDKKLVTGMRTFGLAEGGVDWVHEGPHAAGLPADVVAKVEALRADVIAGKIKVPRE